MNRFPKPVVMALIVTILAAHQAGAQQVTKVGTTAAKFLSIPVGARALGMGGAFVAVANDASAMYWNPGGIARLSQAEAMFSHSNWIADINHDYGGVILPLGESGTIGLNFTALTFGEMERTTEDFPEGTGQIFTASSIAIGVAYGRNLTEWFSIGANVKYVHEKIWNSSAKGIAVDIGTLFNTPFPGVKFGAGVSNFGQKLRITGDDLIVQKDISPNAGNNPNVNAELRTDEFDMPLNLRIGFSYEPIASDEQSLILVVDAMHPNDNSESISLGGEYSAFMRTVALRFGYKGIGMRDSEEDLTVGGGVKYAISDNFAVKFDYAYEKFGRLSSVHKFTVGVLF